MIELMKSCANVTTTEKAHQEDDFWHEWVTEGCYSTAKNS